MYPVIRSLLLVTMVSACAVGNPFQRDTAPDDPVISVNEASGDDVLRPRARSDDGTNTPAPEPAADGFLGATLAGLGAPGEAGMWLSTGLVSSVGRGRVVTEGGRSLGLELRPSGAAPGAGSQISLQAMQALGLPLGQLATLQVYVD